MIRRSFFFVLTVVLAAWAGYQLAWNREVFESLKSTEAIGFLALAIGAVAFLVWSMLQPSWWKVPVAFVLGLFAAQLGSELFEVNVWWAFLAVVIAFALWAATTWTVLPARVQRWYDTARQRAAGPNSPAAAPPAQPVSQATPVVPVATPVTVQSPTP
jgi:hypothetical protein